MYNNIVKIAKNIIAKNQAKKLLDYFISEAPNGLTEDQKQLIKQKISYIQKNSFNFVWFAHRFIYQKKHYQDIEPLLKLTKAYSKLNKQLKTFKFNDNNSFAMFQQFMQKYIKSNVKNNEFQKPTYCPLIHSDNKYNYYYADAKDKKCFEQLHKCNTKSDGKQYAMWCVVTGTMGWGNYTNSKFPFYVYVTDKKNIPFMLFNFGYNGNAQIKDIHDNSFRKYTKQIINSITKIAEKYNFNLESGDIEGDFELLSSIINLHKDTTIDDILKNTKPIFKNKKYAKYQNYNQDNIIDITTKQLSYIFTDGEQIPFNNHSFNDQYLWQLLKATDDEYNSISIIKKHGQLTQKTLNFVLNWFIEFDYDNRIKELIDSNKIKQINEEQIRNMIHCESYKVMATLINNNFINVIKYKNILDIMLTQPEAVEGLTQLILCNRIIWDSNLIPLFEKSKRFDLLASLITEKKIQFTENILNILIKEDCQSQLFAILSTNRYIRGNQKIIQLFIDKKHFSLLVSIYNKFKKPQDAKNFQSVFVQNNRFQQLKDLLYWNQVSMSNETLDYLLEMNQLDYLFNGIIRFNDINKKIQDINYFVKKMKEKKYYSILSNAIMYNNLPCTEDLMQFFANQKKSNIIFQLISKDFIGLSKNVINICMKNNLFYLLTSLFIQGYFDPNREKYILDFLKKNEYKFNPITKIRFKKFVEDLENN